MGYYISSVYWYISDIYQVNLKYILDICIFWVHFRYISGISQIYLIYISCLSLVHLSCIMVLSQLNIRRFLRHISGISQAYLRNILGLYQIIPDIVMLISGLERVQVLYKQVLPISWPPSPSISKTSMASDPSPPLKCLYNTWTAICSNVHYILY